MDRRHHINQSIDIFIFSKDITGWTENLDTYYAAAASATSGDAFSPTTGYDN